ncbi:TIGR01212 family radical SAM protein [Spirochaeta cellobiosiphila]|uniref:TIGR01212 family radical SAM protein n=1 Tax=Spirochaeta cellobiosiphila TaxID=504483 RepID=UPI001B7FAC54|nr:TIGR01212 family radical SAM protein [Spirochaeta cellobiosiphila]
MDAPIVFNNYSRYLKKKYNKPAYRLGLDGGFSCPNRGKDRTKEGCSYCDAYGARAPYLTGAHSLTDQIRQSLGFLRQRYGAEIFLLYFQAYTSTWAPLDRLKALYDSALSEADFRELIVSTRPDCFGDKVADLLSSYRTEEREVWAEFGLQSAKDITLKRINRGHGVKQYIESVKRAQDRDIKIVTHLIFGLPGETERDILDSVDFVVDQGVQGIKIHNLHIPQHSPLYKDYISGEITLPSMERHMDYCQKALERIPEDIVILRLTNDTMKDGTLLPGVMWDKTFFYDRLRRRMGEAGSFQGCKYKRRVE